MRIFLITLLSLVLVACAASDGTSTGNPLVTLSFDSFNSTLALSKTVKEIEPLAVTSLKFCFKRLRFKKAGVSTDPDPTQDEDNVDFDLGEVSVSSLGTNLGSISLPAGTYKRIEFDLEDDCSSLGKSIEVTNGNGTFSTDDRITIKFEGTFTHTGADESLGLNIQAIVSALNTVTSGAQIENKVESVDGSF